MTVAHRAIARQPEAMGDIRPTMITGVALAGALALYAFVIAILLAVALGFPHQAPEGGRPSERTLERESSA